MAGVPITLLIRGTCCLRPGIPGVSENIEVRSIVDQFLEHSRLFQFANNGQPEVYLGSADWMPRNLRRRVEVIFPIEDPKIKTRLLDQLIPCYLQDNVKTRRLLPDGTHERLKAKETEKASRCQARFVQMAEKENQAALQTAPLHPKKILKPLPNEE
ncbi:MAG: hypothetical protein HC904_05735 [Blastochloris sp.]|nr:hypothetical protein [Blastochloris sp.]